MPAQIKLTSITWLQAVDQGGQSVVAITIDDYKALGQNMIAIKSSLQNKNNVITYYVECNSQGE